MAEAKMKIHQVDEIVERKWDIDPARGIVQREYRTLKPTDTKVLVHEGKEYKVQKDGSFEVPVLLGRTLVKRNLGWHEGAGVDLLPSPEEMEALVAASKSSKA